MRPTLTIASSLMPHLPWWRNVSMPECMIPHSIEIVTRNLAAAAGEEAAVTGVAITIRVPCSATPEDTLLLRSRLPWVPPEPRAEVVVVKFE